MDINKFKFIYNWEEFEFRHFNMEIASEGTGGPSPPHKGLPLTYSTSKYSSD